LYSSPAGAIKEWQFEALSPGIVSSTCIEYRQVGQWFLQLFLSGATFVPHFAHSKPSLICMKFRLWFVIIFLLACEEWTW